MPIKVGSSDYSPKRVRFEIRSSRGQWSLALRPMRDINGHESGYQPFLAPEAWSAKSEEECIAWAERIIDAVEGTAEQLPQS